MTIPGDGKLLHNLLLFGRLLRGLGLDINPGRMIDLIQALDTIDLLNKSDFYFASRGLLVHKKSDIPIFDQAFELFWQKPGADSVIISSTGMRPNTQKKKPTVIPPPLEPVQTYDLSSDINDDPDDSEPSVIEATMTYSTQEVLRNKDFSDMTGDELEALKILMQNLTLRLGSRHTRRRRPGDRGRLDLRRSLRKSLRYSGEILEWEKRQRKIKPRPIVVIADVSGSMERYTRLLLHFIYGLAQDRHHPLEAFVFSTRLTRITNQLKKRQIEAALGEVSKSVHDWAGGTRTGESLKTFNYIWGRRVLGRGAVVLLISDGWDRGSIDLLEKEMDRLQRSCSRTIWLNPLLGSPVYKPLTRGIQAALPFVDDFLPVHNLTSLEDLAHHLEKI